MKKIFISLVFLTSCSSLYPKDDFPTEIIFYTASAIPLSYAGYQIYQTASHQPEFVGQYADKAKHDWQVGQGIKIAAGCVIAAASIISGIVLQKNRQKEESNSQPNNVITHEVSSGPQYGEL